MQPSPTKQSGAIIAFSLHSKSLESLASKDDEKFARSEFVYLYNLNSEVLNSLSFLFSGRIFNRFILLWTCQSTSQHKKAFLQSLCSNNRICP